VRSPTRLQADRLRGLASGLVVLSPRRSEWMPLLRAGWVEKVDPNVSVRGGFLPPLRITAEGYEALAVGLRRHGWPDVSA
jgi:hypothetical protein